MEKEKRRLAGLLEKAVGGMVPNEKFGLLFSAGIDSATIALLLKRFRPEFTCLFACVEGIGEPKDLAFAKELSAELGLKLEIVSVKPEEVPCLALRAMKLVNSANPVTIGVALPILACCERAKELGIKALFSGMGSDEIFLGYAKFRSSANPKADSLKALEKLHSDDLLRDKALCASCGISLKAPFLDNKVIEFAFSLPLESALSGSRNKLILRETAKALGLKEKFAERKKVAAQYGSNFDRCLERLARQSGAKTKSEYLSRLKPKNAEPIACLFSGGKDSCLALWLMQKQNYEVKCLVSILPKNEDSFMYHKPDPKILKLQSSALGIPLLLASTAGEKEKELSALKSALSSAKKEFGIQGVVSGALYSNYQAGRIQKICSDLGLRLHSPLWHRKQLDELHELEKAGFVFVISKIAAKGLSEKWLGKPVGKKEISELAELERLLCFNVAGEGGEYESLVLDAPNFGKRIALKKFSKKMRNEFTGCLKIGNAVLAKRKA